MLKITIRPVSLFWLVTILLLIGLTAFQPKRIVSQDSSPTASATFPALGVIHAAQNINLRSGPSTTDAVLAVLSPGTALIVMHLSADGAWQQVQLSDGKQGWVSAALLDVVGTVTPTPTPFPTAAPLPTANQAVLALAAQIVTANNQWLPVMQTFNNVEMVLVPVGCFDMGSTDGESDEQPVSPQCFDKPFWLDRTEVSNAQFALQGGQAANPSIWSDMNRPREHITWFEAHNFCLMRDARLPTESEWEYAARGPDDLIYPWGDDFNPDNAVFGRNSSSHTADVGSHPGGASWVGALNMTGNVWEWVSTIYGLFDYSTTEFSQMFGYPYNSSDGREQDSKDDRTLIRVMRGGSWYESIDNLRAANRGWNYPVQAGVDIGFRCARDF